MDDDNKTIAHLDEITCDLELFEELMGPYDDWDDIPKSWKRRVKGERFQPDTKGANDAKSESESRSMKPLSETKSLRMVPRIPPISVRRSFSDETGKSWDIQFL